MTEITMNKKQCLPKKYHKTKIKRKKNHDSLIEKKRATPFFTFNANNNFGCFVLFCSDL